MSEPNWGMIRSGECFEALVHALVFADDHQAKLMDRPGKDKGVDALSGDGLTVYQAKFGINLTMDYAILRAEAEMAKIKAHRENGDETWCKVENWVLYANIELNTWDVEKWLVFALKFKKVTGLDAECYNIALINQQLIDQPEIEQEFFEGRNRCLLYAQETYLKLEQQSFLSGFHKTKFIGRDSDIQNAIGYLDSERNRIIVVTGRSGIGRTRFLYELFVKMSLNAVRAYWGLSESMEQSDSWFRSLSIGERIAVFVDDCNEKVLGLILDQLNAVGLDQICYIVSCPDECLSRVTPILRRVDCAAKIELQRLSDDDMEAVVRSFEGIGRLRPERVGGICRLSSGFPGWAVFILSFKTMGNSVSPMDIAGDVIEKALQSIPQRWQETSEELLRWIALWGRVDFDGNGKDQISNFLAARGITRKVLDEAIRYLCAAGIVRRSKLQGCVCRVTNRIIQHEVLLRWLIDMEAYSQGNELRLTSSGKDLIEMLISGKFPLFAETLGVLASVSISHFPGADAQTFASPVLKDIANKINSAESITSLYAAYAFEAAWNIGICDPLNTIAILKAIKNNKSLDSEINDRVYGGWTLNHNQVCSKIPSLVKNIAENIEKEDIGLRYFDFLLELWRDKDSSNIEFEDGFEPDKVIEQLILSSAPDNIYHKIAFKFVKKHFSEIPKTEYLRKILSLLFLLRLNRAYSHMHRQIVMEHAYIIPGTEPWAQWVDLRNSVVATIRNESDSSKRCIWWDLFSNAHRQLLNLADFDSDKTGDRVKIYSDILKEDISFAYEFLSSNEGQIPFVERVVMRHIWEDSLERELFTITDEVHKLALGCEQLYASGIEYNIREIFQPETGRNRDSARKEIEKVARLFIKPPEGDFYVRFFDAAAEYLKAVNTDPDIDYGRTEEIAIAVYEKSSAKYRVGSCSCLDGYIKSVLADYVNAGILAKKFVSGTLRLYIKDLKEDRSEEGFDLAWEEVSGHVKSTEGMRLLIPDIYCRANEKATGYFSQKELEKLLSVGMDRRSLINIVPAYYGINEELVTEQLRKALEGALSNKDGVSLPKMMIYRFYVATFQDIVAPNERLLDWFMDLFLKKVIPLSNIYSYRFEYIFEQSKYKYPIRYLKALFESGQTFDHGFEISKYFEVGDDKGMFFELCDWVLDDGPNAFLRRYSLPGYLTSLDIGGSLVSEFVNKKCEEFKDNVKGLERLALFAGCLKNDTSEWRAIAVKICEISKDWTSEDRQCVYNSLNPRFFMWHGVRGEVSPDIINRLDVARENLLKESEDAPLRGYWEFEFSLAEGEYKRALADIEEDEDE